MSKFSERTPTKKGYIGESLVDKIFEKMGYVIYQPATLNMPHPFDRIIATPDKKTLTAVDIKSKSVRKIYYDTGINERNYKEYTFLAEQHNLDVWLVFVDEELGQIYGNTIKELSKPRLCATRKGTTQLFHYPWLTQTKRGDRIIYFPYSAMIHLGELSEADVLSLKNFTTKDNRYLPPASLFSDQ